MSILNIREAVRAGSKVVLGIAGISGSGKTYTALKIARGMVNNSKEIGFLDTENRRGSLYADILDGSFMIGDLYAPFSPERYAQAIKEFQDYGVEVLVIDSITHAWEGDGGCDDIASSTNSKIQNWKLAKAEYKKFMRAMLQSDMHIIACIRAREKMDFRNPSKPVSLGIQPVTEKNTMFEMTTSMMMHNEGTSQQILKCPESLRHAFGNGQGYIGEECGKAIKSWVDAGAKVDEVLESWKNKLTVAADGGLKSFECEVDKARKALGGDKARAAAIKPHVESCRESAKEFDRIKEIQESNSDLDSNTLNETPQIPVGGDFNPLTSGKQ